MPLPKPLLRPDKSAQKYDFGHVLIVAGSPNMLGAAVLASQAALRAGAGLVTCAVASSLNLTLQKKLNPGVMTLPLTQTPQGNVSVKAYGQLQKIWHKFNAIAVGPGLGLGESTQRFILKLIQLCPKPLVIDADALNALSMHVHILQQNKGVKVLTPHEGEMARLTGLTRDYIRKNRSKVALDFAKEHHCIVVLKGHQSVIASGSKVVINETGNPAMAKAGCGDVLTGMIAALLGQGIAPFEAVRWAVYLHGKAGDKAVKGMAKYGLIATDIIEQIPYVT